MLDVVGFVEFVAAIGDIVGSVTEAVDSVRQSAVSPDADSLYNGYPTSDGSDDVGTDDEMRQID